MKQFIRLFALVFLAGLIGPAQANFAIFQVANNARPTADVVCNLTTGVATGVGAGTCATTTAVCDGSNNDDGAFTAFNDWAVNTWQASHSGLIELQLPVGTCQFKSPGSGNRFGLGIKRLQVVGYGTTLSDGGGTGNGFFLGATGIFFDDSHSARIATISAGSTSITLNNTALCSLYNDGDWTLLAGIDPQGFGDPPNPQIYEYIQISSVASCAGSGAITLATPTLYGYKSTWPLYNAGSIFNSDLGGPATVYALDQRWVTNQAFYGLTINQIAGQTNANGQYISFYDLVVPPGQTACPIPSQNVTWTIVNGNVPDCAIEVDKLVQSVTFTNITIRRIIFQSGADPQHFTCTNCAIALGVSGLAGIATFNGGTIADLQLGASFGFPGSFTANNTVISVLRPQSSVQMNRVDARGTWAGGTFTVPANFHFTGSASNGSGLIRLTVDSTAGWSTGFVTDLLSFSGIGASSLCTQTVPLTVIDGTHFDIQGSDATANNVSISIASPAVVTKASHGFVADTRVVFGTSGSLPTGLTAGTSYFVLAAGLSSNAFEVSTSVGGAAVNTSGSQAGQQFLQCSGNGGSLPLTWAVPRANIYFSAGQAPLGPILQVADLAVGANNSTVVSFNQNGSPYAGGFPTMPGTEFSITTHPAPQWTCIGCTGALNVTDVTGAAAAGLPLGSYASRVLTAANSDAATMSVFGALTELDYTVTSACSGASNVGLEQIAFITTLGSATVGSWNPTVNGLIASATPRILTPTGSSGTQSGDSLTPPGVGTWLVFQQTIPLYSNVGNCGSASTTVTIKTNQGVVYP